MFNLFLGGSIIMILLNQWILAYNMKKILRKLGDE